MSNLKLGNMLRPQVPTRQSSSPSLSRPMPPIPPFGSAGGGAVLLSPLKSSSVQLRDLTPTSSAVHRSGTPTGIGRPASAPRSSSASCKVTKLAQATFEAQSANASLKRHPSRRRVRRWENANLLLGEAGLSLSMAQLELEDEEAPEGRGYGIVVDMPSCFRKLFLDENASALEAFRACAEGLSSKSGPSQHQASLSVSQRAWMQVERRLRQVVRRVILSQPETHAYCRGLEMLLVCLAHSGALPEPEMMPEALRALLVARPSVDSFFPSEDKSVGESEGGVIGRELTLHLADSSFHRLLLHAVCQFYGLKSKSTSEGKPRGRAKSRGGTKVGGSSKATQVIFGRRLSASLEARASLVGFLLLGLCDEEAVAEMGIE